MWVPCVGTPGGTGKQQHATPKDAQALHNNNDLVSLMLGLKTTSTVEVPVLARVGA